MTNFVFLLEEPSAKAMLQGILPRILPTDIDVYFMVFEGKQDLHKRLVMRMRHWQKPGSRFVILRDQDNANCRDIKQELIALCIQAGEPTALIRIACHELESFYLGDLAAVEKGLKLNGLLKQQGSQKFRDPDALSNASEELMKLTRQYYQKLSGSRAIGPYLQLDGSNRSRSFNALIQGLLHIKTA